MALRLLEIIVPEQYYNDVSDILTQNEISEYWQTCSCESRVIFKIILQTGRSETIMDQFESRFKGLPDFRMILQPLEASFPTPKDLEQKFSTGEKNGKGKIPMRVSRQELYNDLFERSKLNSVFLIMVVLSSVVASVGLLRDNVAVIVGAMVIAPLLGPNVAMSFATTLGDNDMAGKALKTNFSGMLLAFFLSCLIGIFFQIDPDHPEIMSRTVVSYADIILALASGIAGALAYTTGAPSTLIGVMVAVALIPPLVTSGLLMGTGFYLQSLNAFLLFLINMICINLAGVITFLVQGIRPKSWWEANKAKKATKKAVLLWTLLLIVLALLLFISGY